MCFGKECRQTKRGPFALAEHARQLHALPRPNQLGLMEQGALVAPCAGNSHTLKVQAVRLPGEGVTDDLRNVLLGEFEDLPCNWSGRRGGLGRLKRFALP